MVSIVFGFLVFLVPGVGMVAVALMFQIYAILSGVLLAQAWRLSRPVREERRQNQERRTGLAH